MIAETLTRNALADELTELDGPAPLRGVDGCVLGTDAATGAMTLMCRFPSAWRAALQAADSTFEAFVLEGDLNLDAMRLGSGGFVAVPQSSAGAELSSEGGALVLVFWSPDLPLVPGPGTRVRAVDTLIEPWQADPNPGYGPQVVTKPLRIPDYYTEEFQGGPGGMLRMTVMRPGYFDPRQHVHRECSEEMIVLRGELLVGGHGIMALGSHISSPRGAWHGPLFSQTGCVVIQRTDAPMRPPEFRDAPSGTELGEQHMRSYPWAGAPRHAEPAELPELAQWLHA